MLAFVGVALFGAGLAFTIVNRLGGETAILRELSPYDIWIVVSGALGAMAGLWFGKSHLGHPGWAGIWRGAKGATIVTFAATVCAGTLALPGYGTMFGPFAAMLAFWDSPLLLTFWAIMLVACHMLFAIRRREMDTLFVIHDDGIPLT